MGGMINSKLKSLAVDHSSDPKPETKPVAEEEKEPETKPAPAQSKLSKKDQVTAQMIRKQAELKTKSDVPTLQAAIEKHLETKDVTFEGKGTLDTAQIIVRDLDGNTVATIKHSGKQITVNGIKVDNVYDALTETDKVISSVKYRVSPQTESAINNVSDNRAFTDRAVKAFKKVIPSSEIKSIKTTETSAVITLQDGNEIHINTLTGDIYVSETVKATGRIQFRPMGNVNAIVDIVRSWYSGDMSAYHEAGHYAFEMFLSQESKAALLAKYGDEESAMEAFAMRMIERDESGKRISGKIQEIFQSLWLKLRMFINRMMGRTFLPNAQDVFQMMRYGVYGALSAEESQLSTALSGAMRIDTTEAEQQMAEVRSKYVGTDEWMKAPNGKPTNLNERQWLQVRTPNFLKWFGDWLKDPKNASKVVDENGEPKPVYHWTASDFTEFITAGGSNTPGMLDVGTWFTAEKEKTSAIPTASDIKMDVFLNIRNPKSYDALDYFFLDVSEIAEKDANDNGEEYYSDNINTYPYLAILDDKGKDGIYIDYDFESQSETYIALLPTQIKSATANVGTFDPNNPDIRYRIDINVQKTARQKTEAQRAVEQEVIYRTHQDFTNRITNLQKGISDKTIKGKAVKVERDAIYDDYIEFLEKRVSKAIIDDKNLIQNTIDSLKDRSRNKLKGVQDAMRRISRLSDATARTAIPAMKKLLKKMIPTAKDEANFLKNNKLTGEQAGEAKEIARLIKMSPDDVMLYIAKQNMSIDKLTAQEESDEPISEQSNAISRTVLQAEHNIYIAELFGNLSNADAPTIARAYNHLAELYKLGKSIKQQKREEAHQRYQNTRNKLFALITGMKPLLTKFESEQRAKTILAKLQKATRAGAFMETLIEELDALAYRNGESILQAHKELAESLKTPLDEEASKAEQQQRAEDKSLKAALDELVPLINEYQGDFKGWANRTFFEPVFAATRNEYKDISEKEKMLHAKRAEIYRQINPDATKLDALSFFYQKYKTRHYTINWLDQNGQRVDRKFSVSVLASVYAHSLNEDMKETLANTGFDESALEQIENILNADEVGKYAKAWAEYLVDEFYPSVWPEYNQAHLDYYGVPLGKWENYVPVHRDIFTEEKVKNIGEKDYSIISNVSSNHNIERVKSKRSLNIDNLNIDENLNNYISSMEHFKHFAQLLYDLKNTILRRDMQKIMNRYLGEEYTAKFSEYVNAIALNKRRNFNMNTVFEKLKNRMFMSVMLVNAFSFIKQIGSIPVFYNYLNTGGAFKFTSGVMWSLSHWKELYGIYKESPILQKRYTLGQNIEIQRALESDDIMSIASEIKAQANKIAFARAGDMIAVMIGGGALYINHYNEYLNGGMSKAEARAKAINDMERATVRSQQTAEIFGVTALQADKVGSFVAAFRSAQIAYFNIWLNLANDIRGGKKSKWRMFRQATNMLIMSKLIYAMFDSAFVPRDSWDDWLYDLMYHAFGDMILIGWLLQPVLEGMRRGRYRGGSMIPLDSAIQQSMTTTFKGVGDILNDPADAKAWWDTIAGTSNLTGVPLQGATRLYRGWSDYLSGTDNNVRRLIGLKPEYIGMLESLYESQAEE
jgi:hypothetical protein